MDRRRWLIGSGVATALLYAAMVVLERKLTDAGGASIVGFELAGSKGRAAEIVAEWGSSGRDYARASLWIDYPFMLAYGTFLTLAALATRDFARRHGRAALAAAGALAPFAAVATAGFDAVENVFLLLTLGGHGGSAGPALATAAASVKFLLLALTIAYLAWGLASRMRLRRAARQPA